MSALSLLLFFFPPNADADGLDKDAIRSVVRNNIRDIRGCYNAGLQQDADLEGRISLRLKITAKGDVEDATVLDAEFDEGVPACMADAVQDWEFPRAEKNTVITYPFVFSPG